jgi:poly-gamma-glutamate capsule biosynthesis protein CapA/YwtB (metallophosphatase superfamily)
MRAVGLLLRAGVVVIVLAGIFATLDGGAPEPAASAARTVRQPPPTTRTPVSRKVPEGAVTIAATGDIVMGSTPRLPPAGGARFFDAVTPALRGGVVLGNLEGTLSSGGASKCGAASTNCYAFQMPPPYARWLKRAHFTVLNLANNHSYDFGATGLEQTVAALDAQGLRHIGRPGEIAYQRVGAIRVALVGFAPYPWAQDLNDRSAARALVREADRNADVVVVTMHAGAEGRDRSSTPRSTEYFLGENRGNVRAFAHAVVDAGADLVAGHGPHVLRGMEWYRGRLIAYSLGNFAGYKVFALSGPLAVSGVLRATLRGDGRFVRGQLVATRLTADGTPVLDPRGQAHALVRMHSRADFGAHAVSVSQTGVLG